MTIREYSKRLGSISPGQFQAALDRFELGQFIHAEAIPFGLFGQNVFVTSSAGEFVLRGAAHYDWQFPKEQFVANLLHAQTRVPVPYPYLLDDDETIFGWKYGYALMPRMPGLQLADAQVLKSLSFEDRQAIAHTIGENLHTVQQAQWQFSGQYDYTTRTIRAFEDDFGGWLVSELRRLLQLSISFETGTTRGDETWIESLIEETQAALSVPFPPVLVLHDYKEGNLTVTRQANRWQVSGLFDLMEALIGDGEYDLVRQLALYMEESDLSWAQAFLAGYQLNTPLRPGAAKRLALYLLYDRMIVWEYWLRPENVARWEYANRSAKAWISPYLDKLNTLL